MNQTDLPANKMASTSVYFVPASVRYASDRDVFSLETILAHRRYPFLSRFRNQGVIAVKSCENFSVPALRYATAFIRLLKNNGQSAFLCGTSNSHMDYQSNGIVCAHDALDTCETAGEWVPFMALDGIYGEHEITRKSNQRLEAHVYLAGELPNLDGLISVSCFGPSAETNPCGSIVTLGQGLASKKGKIHQRTTDCPQVHVKKCYACRRCVRACPTHAISILDGHVVIDSRKCVKCGRCVEIAHYGGITHDWNATPDHYNRSVAKHAKAVLAVLDNRVTCVNIIKSDESQDTFAGAMISQDPVAVDSATLDYCRNHELLQDGPIQQIKGLIDTANSAGAGTVRYTLETVAY